MSVPSNNIKAGPLVSVIIPVYNGESYLSQAIESVLAQTYQAVEIIVVDDGSTDNRAKAAKRFSPARYYHHPHEGVSTARNYGISVSKGEYLAFLDADDIWYPDKLTVQMGYMLAHPDIQYTVTNMRYFLEPGCDLPYGFRKELLGQEPAGYILDTLLIRRDIFEKVGPFNPSLRAAEDVDWFCRAKDKDLTVEVIPQVLLKKRLHDTNLTIDVDKSNRDLLWVLKQSIGRKQEKVG